MPERCDLMPSTPWATSTLGLHLQFCQINTEGRMSMFLMQKNFPRAEVSDARLSHPLPGSLQSPVPSTLNPHPSLAAQVTGLLAMSIIHTYMCMYIASSPSGQLGLEEKTLSFKHQSRFFLRVPRLTLRWTWWATLLSRWGPPATAPC